MSSCETTAGVSATRHHPSPEGPGNTPAVVNSSDSDNLLLGSSYANVKLHKMSGPNFTEFMSEKSYREVEVLIPAVSNGNRWIHSHWPMRGSNSLDQNHIQCAETHQSLKVVG